MTTLLIIVHLVAAALFVVMGWALHYLSARSLEGWRMTAKAVKASADALEANNNLGRAALDFAKDLVK